MTHRGLRQFVSRYVSRFKTCGRDHSCSWKRCDTTSTLSFHMTTLWLDARHRTKNTLRITIMNSGTGKDTSWNWRPDGHAEFSVATRGLDECYERSIQNVSRDRLIKIQYSDHVKSQYAVIFRHVTRSWIYFINQKSHRIFQTDQLYSWWLLDWTICTDEQFCFLRCSWALWSNWNENQIVIFRSFRIPVILVKWNEKTYLLNKYKYIMYIYI